VSSEKPPRAAGPGVRAAPPQGGPAAASWAHDLDAWRIPDEILAQAPRSPWIHPIELFRADPASIPESPSHRLAREAVPVGGSVLDVGCGGGRAAFAVTPPAGHVFGVDQQQGMLDAFAAVADERSVAHSETLGDWPAVEQQAPVADVVVCHHVAYNVAALAPFATALHRHARHRVVLELPERHPLAPMTPFWRHFWSLDRPVGPTAADALGVLREAGLPARIETWVEDGGRRLDGVPWQRQVEFLRIRLCLTPERDEELAAVMRAQGPAGPRRMATIWWDAAG
jgi:SAM-dependent methyltransferase